MELHGKHCAFENLKYLHASSDGRHQVKTHVTDKFPEAQQKAKLKAITDSFTSDVTDAFMHHMYIDPNVAVPVEPTEPENGKDPEMDMFRKPDVPFDSILYRRHADSSLYSAIMSTFTHQDWQLRFQQKASS